MKAKWSRARSFEFGSGTLIASDFLTQMLVLKKVKNRIDAVEHSVHVRMGQYTDT